MKIELETKYIKFFNLMKNRPNESLYYITITDVKVNTIKGYRSKVRSGLFTPSRKHTLSKGLGCDCIIAVEYDPELGKGSLKMIDAIVLHAHILFSAEIKEDKLSQIIKKNFNSGENIDIINITNSDTKDFSCGYHFKQRDILTEDNFLFHIREVDKHNYKKRITI